jgi:hypothetical protein
MLWKPFEGMYGLSSRHDRRRPCRASSGAPAMSAFESMVWMVWLAFMLSPLVVLFGTVVAAIRAAIDASMKETP